MKNSSVKKSSVHPTSKKLQSSSMKKIQGGMVKGGIKKNLGDTAISSKPIA